MVFFFTKVAGLLVYIPLTETWFLASKLRQVHPGSRGPSGSWCSPFGTTSSNRCSSPAAGWPSLKRRENVWHVETNEPPVDMDVSENN